MFFEERRLTSDKGNVSSKESALTVDNGKKKGQKKCYQLGVWTIWVKEIVEKVEQFWLEAPRLMILLILSPIYETIIMSFE